MGAHLLARAIVRWAIPGPRTRPRYTSPAPASVGNPTTNAPADGPTTHVMAEPGVLRAELNRAAAGNRPLSEQSNQSSASSADTVQHGWEYVVPVECANDDRATSVAPITKERKLASHRPPSIDPNAEQAIFSDFESPMDVEEDEGLVNDDVQSGRPASVCIKEAVAESMRASSPTAESLQAETPADDAAGGASQDSTAAELLCDNGLVELISYPSPFDLTRSASAGAAQCAKENMLGFSTEGILSSKAEQEQKGLDRGVVLGDLRVGNGCPRAIRSRPSTPSIPLFSGAGMSTSSAEARISPSRTGASGSSKTRAKYGVVHATRAALGNIMPLPLDHAHCEGRFVTEGGGGGVGGRTTVANGAVRLEALDRLFDRGDSKRSDPFQLSTNAWARLRSQSAEPPSAAGRRRAFVGGDANMGSMRQAASQAKWMRRVTQQCSVTGQCDAYKTDGAPPLQSRNGLEGEQPAKQEEQQGAAEPSRERGRTDLGKLYRLGRPSSRAWR